MNAIVEELRSGEKGFVVVPGVFPPEEIAEARERILALIGSQGEKATHFQAPQFPKKNMNIGMKDASTIGRARIRMKRRMRRRSSPLAYGIY